MEESIEAIAEPAQEPEDLNDRLLTAISRPEVEITDAKGMTLRQIKPNHMPSDIRRMMLDRLPGAIDHAERLVMGSDSPKAAIAYADFLAKSTVGVVKGVSLENREFAKAVLQVIMEVGGPEIFDKCLPRIEAIMMQLDSSE